MNNELKIKRLVYIYDNLLSSLLVVIFLSHVVLFSLYDVVLKEKLFAWYGVSMFIVLLRTLLLITYKKTTLNLENFKRYYMLFFLGVLVSTLLWGIGIIMVMPPQAEYQIFLVLLVLGLTTGSIMSNATHIELVYAYIVLSFTPLFIFFLLKENNIAYSVSFAILIYTLFTVVTARKISKGIIENIAFRMENNTLIEKLKEEAQKANSANEAKSQFLSVMSHEIRTPLNAIIGFIKVLRKSETDEKKAKYLKTIDRSSYVLLNVINDILDITKIESGKLELEKAPFNLHEEAKLFYELFLEVANEKDVRLTLELSEDVPVQILDDKLRLKQIVSNLLSNAIKFTPAGKCVTLSVDYNQLDSQLLFSVNDEGIGIEKENIEKVLQAFSQADSSTSREYGGTGLGLTIVTKLLDLYGTQLQISSEVGEGSHFSFAIAVEVLENTTVQINSEESTQSADEEEVHVDFHHKKVLVAEDNKTNQMLINLLLQDMNLNVTLANDGLLAKEACEREYFDIVLMDINMPNMNGVEAMHAIRHVKSQKGESINVIALTANSVSGDKEKYIAEGFDDYLSKPIDNNELIVVLEKYL